MGTQSSRVGTQNQGSQALPEIDCTARRSRKYPLFLVADESREDTVRTPKPAEGSESEEDGGIPRILIGFVGILDASPDIAQQVTGVVQIVTDTDTHTGRCGCPGSIRGLMGKFHAQLQFREHLVGQHTSSRAKILRAESTDHASAAAEGRPAAGPIFLYPDWQEYRGAIVTNRMGAAGEKNARENADIEAEAVLVQEAVFRGELDIPQADVGRAAGLNIETGRHGCGQLEIRSGTIVEIDAGLAACAAFRGDAGVERVDFKVLVVGGLRVIGDI